MSVATPGHSFVTIFLIGFIFSGPAIDINFSFIFIFAPTFLRRFNSVFINFGSKPFIFKFPFEIVAATQKVPHSILSPITE